MQKIKKKTAQIRKEAEKIGEDVELAMKKRKQNWNDQEKKLISQDALF